MKIGEEMTYRHCPRCDQPVEIAVERWSDDGEWWEVHGRCICDTYLDGGDRSKAGAIADADHGIAQTMRLEIVIR